MATGVKDEKFLEQIMQAPPEEQERLLDLLKEYEEAQERAAAQTDFMAYVKKMWPAFIHGQHHKQMAQAFEAVLDDKCKRLIISMPPRHTKSEFSSYLLPSWFLGRNPDKKVIQCSNTAELAVGFGRRVRNLMDTDTYKDIFPGVELQKDSKAAHRWGTNKGGDYFAIGVGGVVTGKGADLLIIDDPHSEQEAKQAESSPGIFDAVYDWYTSGPRQRLQPGGKIIIIQCMTGDTSVLMGDGSPKALRDVRVGDAVVSYDGGSLRRAKVTNWRSSGYDLVYTIQTRSGRIIRANERHPFLVDRNGSKAWIRLRDLKPGDALVSLPSVTESLEQRQSRDCAAGVRPEKPITRKTPAGQEGSLAFTESGGEGYVQQRGAKDLLGRRACAMFAIAGQTPQGNEPEARRETPTSSIGMGSPLPSTEIWCERGGTGVTFAGKSQAAPTPEPIGEGSCALTIATKPDVSGDFYATTATSWSDTESGQASWLKVLNICGLTEDRIEAIFYSGIEEVFDIEVEGAENFIANGVVSHNTRWSKRDLAGKVLKASVDRGGESWTYLELPAILPSGNPLWPEFWPLEELEALKAELPQSKWQAQYMQQPFSEEGALIKREWWKEWEKDDPPEVRYIIQSWDTAYLAKARSDYSAQTTWGVFDHPDETGKLRPNLILLDAFQRRMEFPQLKSAALELWRRWEPDTFLIEAKAAGSPLIFELRQMGIPVSEFVPTRAKNAFGNGDKIMRVNAIADIFQSGLVWAPPTRWAEEVINQCAEFPAGEHDDLVDTVSMSLIRFRQGGLIGTAHDYRDDDDDLVNPRQRRGYFLR